MSEKIKPTPHRTAAGVEAAAMREARLAAALRANLQRRKAQARGREDAVDRPPADPDSRQT